MAWFKVWDKEWLEKNGEVSLETQGAMVRVMCAANRCMDDGRFTYRQKTPLTMEQILGDAGLTERQWGLVVAEKFVHKNNGVWEIRNWKHYQSEYQRQKGYRK